MMKPNPKPLQVKFWTPGALLLAAIAAGGGVAVLARYTGGIGYVSNLTDARPWGIWIGINVASGVAFAACGFTTAALVHIFGRRRYAPLVRSALLTALLGYTFAVLGLLVEIGRSWAIWKPMFNWNPDSVLFEVAMCVMLYLSVLYIEFIPVVVARLRSATAPRGRTGALVAAAAQRAEAVAVRVMPVCIVAGVVLSCMHQSSLGTLLLIAPTKLHPLWYTPLLPLLFLVSAVSLGFPMVVFENVISHRCFHSRPNMNLLAKLSSITVWLLGVYVALKTGDILVRGTWKYFLDGTFQTNSFLLEFVAGAVVPWCMLLSGKIRRSATGLFTASALIIAGVLLNRINVFIVGYTPSVSKTAYFPSPAEMLITAGLIATLLLVYRFLVIQLPVITKAGEGASW